jgi:hypothetical protein
MKCQTTQRSRHSLYDGIDQEAIAQREEEGEEEIVEQVLP